MNNRISNQRSNIDEQNKKLSNLEARITEATERLSYEEYSASQLSEDVQRTSRWVKNTLEMRYNIENKLIRYFIDT